jgi:hypothetical protein
MWILPWAFRFVAGHAGLVLGLSLVAALGRAIQLGGLGPVGAVPTAFLEVVVETARLVLFLGVIGLGRVGDGLKTVASAFSRPTGGWRAGGRRVWARLRAEWRALIADIAGFGLIALLINAAIEAFAAPGAYPLIFLLKNLTVIPLTIVFECGLLLFMSGRAGNARPAAPSPVG